MHIKSVEVLAINAQNNVGWIEQKFKFETGQTAYFHTHNHTVKCFNGMGRDITESEIGHKMKTAIMQYNKQSI
jgi:hypothetical protein